MAHRFRSVSFANEGYDEIEGENVEKGVALSELAEGNAKENPENISRRHSEKTPVISDKDYQEMASQAKPRSRTRLSLFRNDDIGELNASKVLTVLTLTSNSKVVGYVDETRKRASTKKIIRQPTLLERTIFEPIEEEPDKPDGGSSLILTIWNVLPLLQGSSVFSMPYAVKAGGYIVLFLLPLISFMGALTSTILVDCMYEDSPKTKQRTRVRKDYVGIARSVWGKNGARVLNFILLFYLFTGNVVNIVLLGKCVYELLSPYTDLSFAVLTSLFSILCFPTLFIKRLTILAYMNFAAIAFVAIGIVTVIVVFITECDKWSGHLRDIAFVHLEGVPLAAGIFMFSCLIHSVLPRVESDMAQPRKANKAVYIAYSVSTVTKTVLAFLGAITFGFSTVSIVSLNVGEINTIARYVTAIVLTGYAITGFPLELFVVCENVDTIIENTSFIKKRRYYYPWLIVTRLLLVSMVTAIALVIPYFGVVLAIRGSLIGTCLMFVFPCYFHLKLKWDSLSSCAKFRDIVILVLGSIIGILALYSSVNQLVISIKS